MADNLRDEIVALSTDKNNDILTAKDYFEKVKNLKRVFTQEDLEQVYDNCLILANKAHATGQIKALKKLVFCMETLGKEKQLIDLGVNTFVYQDDIDYFIDKVSDKPVKIIELENFEREIPDDIMEVVIKTKNIFDAFYVVFTDYTGKVTRQIEKEKRDRDPILFGTFQDKKTYTIVDRFYYLGDWEDDYCDLTLEKMLTQMKEANMENVAHHIGVPKSLDELRACLNAMDENGTVKKEWLEITNQTSGDMANNMNEDKNSDSGETKKKGFLSWLSDLLFR